MKKLAKRCISRKIEFHSIFERQNAKEGQAQNYNCRFPSDKNTISQFEQIVKICRKSLIIKPPDGRLFYMGLCPTPPFYGAMRPIPAGAFLCEESSIKNALETSGFKTSGREGRTPLDSPGFCCHRCTLLQNRKVIRYPLWICSPKSFSKEDTL